MAILGLISTEDLAAERYKNPRRKVFYDYPNGQAPLTGILSLLSEEDTDDPEFSWFEKRYKDLASTTVSQGSSKGPFLTAGGSDAGDSALELTAGTEYEVCVATNEVFRKGHIVKIPVASGGGASMKELQLRITEDPATTGTGKIQGTPLVTLTAVDNGATNENVGREVLVIGSAFEQGAVGSSEAPYFLPIEPSNYCQILRQEFSFPGSVLKTSVRFDDTGVYKDKSKEASIQYMVELERAILFGEKSKSLSAGNMPTYTMGGILYFLRQWEAANSIYRGGSGAAAVTLDTDDNKRIIENSTGRITHKWYSTLLERLFRVTNNKVAEKLFVCGSGYLETINQMYFGMAQLNSNLPATQTFGMDVVSHRTPFGTVYYKTHPLFTNNPTLRYSALALDVQNLRYRYLQGRDVDLLKNRQPNNADYRMDEWLGEAGFECRFPESHMFIKNVLDYTQ